jgi:uncharacterized protein YbbC (DUF1343 family)
MSVRTGLDRLRDAAGDARDGVPAIADRAVALLCHPASVDATLEHAVHVVTRAGAQLVSLLGPEHGLDAAAQDMESVGTGPTLDGVPVHSLYGDTYDSLIPKPEMFHGAERLVIDLQDVGARYYTYVWTALFAAEVALAAGIPVTILDRPNPLGGADASVEGGRVESGFESFVGVHDVATRHGMTLAEIVTLALNERANVSLAQFSVVECEGWERSMMFPQTGLPWVLPSPNMPTFDTAVVYPGQCLLEGTIASEGRGTTRPFEIFGAPGLDGRALADAVDERDRPGLGLRPLFFKPMFQKHAGASCGGVQMHVQDAERVRSVRTTWALLAAMRRLDPGFAWRTERYEFVDDIPAIDLLAGGPWLREGIDAGVAMDELARSQVDARDQFVARRRPFLRYE